MPKVLILIGVAILAAALWVVKPFAGWYDPIEVDIPVVDTTPPVPQTYGAPKSVQAGTAYRRARAKRVMRTAAVYPPHIAERYYDELSKFMDEMSGYKEGETFFPSHSMLRNMDVQQKADKDCDNPKSRINNPRNFKGLTLYMDGVVPPKYPCKVGNQRFASYLKRFNQRQTKVEVSECTWERLSTDAPVLDMIHLYDYKPNAAYLCLVTLYGDRANPIETAGYFAKRAHNDWIFIGGFDEIKFPLRRVRLDPAILKDPEGEARRRWAALPR